MANTCTVCTHGQRGPGRVTEFEVPPGPLSLIRLTTDDEVMRTSMQIAIVCAVIAIGLVSAYVWFTPLLDKPCPDASGTQPGCGISGDPSP
jgi:hypothetical protein